jgi:methyl-accepting chemotaxis protein
VTISQEVAAALEKISDGNHKISDLIEEIANGSDAQAAGLEEISRAVQHADQITQAGVGHARQSATTAEKLTGQADSLNQLIRRLLVLVGGCRATPQDDFIPMAGLETPRVLGQKRSDIAKGAKQTVRSLLQHVVKRNVP